MKRSMYRIRLEWFVPFDPADLATASAVQWQMDQAREFAHLTLIPNGAQMVNFQTKYFARREVPDAPKPVEESTMMHGDALGLNLKPGPAPMPPIPPDLDASKRRP